MFTIFCPRGIRSNAGGPAGYVFNLREGLDIINAECTVIAPEIPVLSNTETDRQMGAFPELRAVAHFFKLGIQTKRKYRGIKFTDLVHVHSVSDVFYLKAMLGYGGKIILTPHCPEETWREKENSLNAKLGVAHLRLLIRALYLFVERYAYNHANGFIFPSPNAEEIYLSFPGFIQNKAKPTRYVITGCPDCRFEYDVNQLRSKFSVQANEFVIAYIGRHNRVKGYDLLVDAFPLFCNEAVRVICAGALGDIHHPASSSWVELGYIKNTDELMEACDVLVVPNRSAYFDLVIIEALSHGTIVVTSKTGGTKDIANRSDGIVCVEDISAKALANAVLSVRSLSKEEILRMKNDNRRLYEKECSLEAFATNYINAVTSLRDELQ